MADRVEITESSDGRPRVVPVEGQLIVIGSAAGAGIVVAGLAPAELRLVRTDRGYRAEPSRPGATVTVNGEALFAKDLAAGDIVDLGTVQLRWLPEARTPVAAPAPRAATKVPRRSAPPPQHTATPAPRRSIPPSPRSAPPPRRSHKPGMPLAALSGIFLSILIGLSLLLRTCSNTTWPKTPQHFVDLARTQYGNGLFQEALGTLDFALGEATGPAREQALQLQEQIKQALATAADTSAVQSARADLDLLRSFVGRYLQQDPNDRPAARELLRLCGEWRTQHGALAARNKETAAMVSQVDSLQGRFSAAAHTDEPDTAADVTFAAQAQLRFQQREYKVAMRLLDVYLAAHPDDDAVRSARTDMLQSGAEWFSSRMRLVDQLIELNRIDAARAELRTLQQVSLLPEWQEVFAAREQRLQGR